MAAPTMQLNRCAIVGENDREILVVGNLMATSSNGYAFLERLLLV